jgi:hypothetical protein
MLGLKKGEVSEKLKTLHNDSLLIENLRLYLTCQL